MNSAASFLEGLRPEIQTLPAYNSGLSAEFVRARYGVARVAKLGSNENLWGTSPRVLEAMVKAVADAGLYPEPDSATLRAALSERLAVEPERLAFGNGSEDLISVVAHAFLAPGDDFLTMIPSFGLHGIYAQAAGAQVRMLPVGELIGAIRPETRMVMFSSPSNPVGTALQAAEVEKLLDAVGPRTLLVFDEAYYEYASVDPEYPDVLGMLRASGKAWLLLRTFSKAWGLAGLRVGYGIASHVGLIDVIDRARTPFNVNRLAQVGAVAALSEVEFMKDCVKKTVEERKRVQAAVTAMGFECSASVANFVFFNAREDGSALAERMLHDGVIVKPWREPGYREYVRVSTGTPDLNDQFLAALRKHSKCV